MAQARAAGADIIEADNRWLAGTYTAVDSYTKACDITAGWSAIIGMSESIAFVYQNGHRFDVLTLCFYAL